MKAKLHISLKMCVHIILTHLKCFCGCRGQSVDHSYEQPAGQNYSDRLQQGETDRLTS